MTPVIAENALAQLIAHKPSQAGDALAQAIEEANGLHDPPP